MQKKTKAKLREIARQRPAQNATREIYMVPSGKPSL